MSAKRRMKAKSVGRKRISFRLVIDFQEMVVDYRPNHMSDYGQFEFRSPHKRARRIPVSNTGYRCHFAPMEDVKASASPKDYAREVVIDIMRSERRGKPELAGQLPLF
jgi:hypothetical protein